jgi:hypothetical protein
MIASVTLSGQSALQTDAASLVMIEPCSGIAVSIVVGLLRKCLWVSGGFSKPYNQRLRVVVNHHFSRAHANKESPSPRDAILTRLYEHGYT